MIIALGETIVITGATTAELDLDAARITAFALAFLGTAALWWLYFDYVARIAQRRLELAPDRTLLARDAYTYLHVVMVAGVIVSAVGDELVIAHPTDVLPGRGGRGRRRPGRPSTCSDTSLFRLRMAGSIELEAPRRGARLRRGRGRRRRRARRSSSPRLVLVVLARGDRRRAARRARRRARGEPSPLERLEASAAGRVDGP